MSYKIIALDIDGTLVNTNKEMTKKTCDTLLELQKSGKKVVLASGRPTQGVLPYAEELKFDKYKGYILSYNGGCVVDVANENKTIYRKSFPNEYIPEICREIKGRNVTINTYQNDTIIAGNVLNDYSNIESDIVGLPLKFVDDFASYVNFDIIKCLLAGDPEEIEELEELFSKKYEGKLGVFRSEPFFLELVPLGINKAESMDVLLKSLGLTKEECIACGDGYNDISLIEYAGLGVAMGNANGKVKAASDYITLTNDEDGVAAVVEKFMM